MNKDIIYDKQQVLPGFSGMVNTLNKSRSEWENFTEEELSAYANDIFLHYRKNGYPYYSYTEKEILDEIANLLNFDLFSIIEDGIIKQTMHALGVCWFFFPHAVEIKNGTARSPLDIFNDDDLLRTAILKRLRYGGNISDAAIRKAVRKYGGVGVSNFRPTAAGAIYQRYGGNVVYDMSAGFGGRMLGAYAAKNVKKYIGVDPSTKTFNGLVKFSKYLHGLETELHCIGSEDFIPAETVDLCFTSPPYFDTERYSDEETQSYIKFPDYQDWINVFWRNTIINCWKSLKEGGFLVFNVANTSTIQTLEKDCLYTAMGIGFDYSETLQLQLSGRPHKNEEDRFKYEPVFVLRKKSS